MRALLINVLLVVLDRLLMDFHTLRRDKLVIAIWAGRRKHEGVLLVARIPVSLDAELGTLSRAQNIVGLALRCTAEICFQVLCSNCTLGVVYTILETKFVSFV